MREIKFRAWDKIREEMNVVRGFCDNTVFIDAATRPLVNQELLQFTGLKDKNGKEIYEGDVIRTWVYHEVDKKHYPHNDRTKVVEWTKSDLYTGWKIGKGVWEVIGNIYENPELVAKESA